jgi:hypothetical protein
MAAQLPPPEGGNGTMAYRMLRAEERIAALEKHEPAVVAERIRVLDRHVEELRGEVRNLKRNAIALGVLIVGAVVADAVARAFIGT